MRPSIPALLVGLLCTPALARSQSAVLAGRVLEDSTSRPVARAQIIVGALSRNVVSDSTGSFTMADVPAGLHTVRIRALGFVPVEQRLVFRADDRIDLDIELRRQVPTLSGVAVSANAVPSFLNEFNARRRLGQGRFLDTTDIAPFVNSQLATLLSAKIPGVRQVRFGGRTALASGRGIASMEQIPGGDVMDRQLGAPKACYVQVIIDNVSVYQGQPDEPLFNSDQVNLLAIAAIEYYTPSNRPSEFKRAGGGPCGSLVIWTKR